MSRTNRTIARSRVTLLATSMFATSLLAGAGGMLAATATPGVVLAQSCNTNRANLPAPGGTPQPNTTAGFPGNNVPGGISTFCQGVFDGIGYGTFSNNNITVTLVPTLPAGAGTSTGPFGVRIFGSGSGTLTFTVYNSHA